MKNNGTDIITDKDDKNADNDNTVSERVNKAPMRYVTAADNMLIRKPIID